MTTYRIIIIIIKLEISPTANSTNSFQLKIHGVRFRVRRSPTTHAPNFSNSEQSTTVCQQCEQKRTAHEKGSKESSQKRRMRDGGGAVRAAVRTPSTATTHCSNDAL